MTKAKKHTIEVRKYLPGQTSYGSESIGKITGNYGRYEIVETVQRQIRFHQIGNFAPAFCTYRGNRACLVHSDEGDLSDPFRADESYLAKLFIDEPYTFEPGDRVTWINPQIKETATSCQHGIVVMYHGTHHRHNPRVRWQSGWGTSCKNVDLRPLTAEECKQYPAPDLVAGVDSL